MAPKVSICIPTYNRKGLLKETLESIFMQTYKDYEVVIVDDGSTDDTEQMIKDTGYPVRYYWQENAGDAAARNKLIKLAYGQYISFLDSDDLLPPDAVERMVGVVSKEPGDVIVYGPYVTIDQDGSVRKRKRKKLHSGYITQNLFENILVHSCGSMFPKKVLEEAGCFNEALPVCADYDLWLRLSQKYRFIAINKPLFKRRRHSGNLSQYSFTNRKTEFEVLENFYYNGGGEKSISSRRAMKRLSKEGYRAGKCAVREGRPEPACQLLRQSFQRHPNLKSLLWWTIATTRLHLAPLETEQSRKKVLVLTSNPSRASFRQRIWIYLDILRDSGIECEVARFPSYPVARWKLLRQSGKFEVVFLHKKSLNFIDASWLRRYARRIIYDFDDAIMYDDKKPAKPDHKRLSSFERTAKLANVVIAGNSYLASHARNFNKNVEILPTGLNVSEFKDNICRPDGGKIRLVWIGSKSTLEYLSGIKPALEEIGSRFDNVVLRIICDEFFDLRNMEVEKCRWSLEKQTSDLAESHIGLAPLPDNKFTQGKCGFKILQYAAMGLPVIASPVGINAKYVQDGGNGFFAVSCSDWVDKILLLLKEPELRKRMGSVGKAYVQQFDASLVGSQLCKLVQKCLESTVS
jgi:glycosyltransferase involved in cell wall biosynthesis